MANEEEQKVLPPEIEEGKTLAAIGYLGILFLIPLLAKKENKFCQFHAKQGAVLFGFEVVAVIILIILTFILTFSPRVGAVLATVLWLVFWVCAVGLSIWGLVMALKGEYWKMLVLGDVADKIKF
jgi:uncharacterized membrane protein